MNDIAPIVGSMIHLLTRNINLKLSCFINNFAGVCKTITIIYKKHESYIHKSRSECYKSYKAINHIITYSYIFTHAFPCTEANSFWVILFSHIT